jgi:3-(3-hydroxy-phenyl)propionate hydroxylase
MEDKVIISGAGPVGMTLALVLGRKDIPVVVLEAGADLNDVSRASTVHGSTLELLNELSVAWDVIDQGKFIDRVQYRDRVTGPIAEFPLDVISDYTNFPIRMQTDQSKITRIIRTRLEKMPHVEIRYGATVTGVTHDDVSVRVSYETASGVEVAEGTYAVAADGAHSNIRRSLSIGFLGEAYEKRYMMVMTTFNVREAMSDLAPVTYISDGTEGLGYLQLPDHHRLAFHLHHDEDATVAAKPENIQRRLKQFLPPIEGDYPVFDVLSYGLQRRIADTFRAGRVFLAGDSAHLNNPSGGMGMNSGIHDAYVLGKALATVIHGDAGDQVLDVYAESRRNSALGYIHLRSDRNFREEEAATAEAIKTRDARLKLAASTSARMRDFVLKASMFDSAPRVQW